MALVLGEQTGRQRVLDAAAGQLVADGYQATTLRQIAAEAGIKAGSIYHHFESKEAIFIAVFDDGIKVMINAFETTSSSLPASAGVEQRLQAHITAHLSAVFEHGPFTTAHVTSFSSAPLEVRKAVVPIRDSYEEKWTELFAELFASVPQTSRRLHRLILFGAMNATAEWFDPAGDTSVAELASTITNQFLNGIQP